MCKLSAVAQCQTSPGRPDWASMWPIEGSTKCSMHVSEMVSFWDSCVGRSLTRWKKSRRSLLDVCTDPLVMTQHRLRIGASDGPLGLFSFPPKPAHVVGASSSSSPSVHSSIIDPARLRQLAPSQGTYGYARLTFLPSTRTPRPLLDKTWQTHLTCHRHACDTLLPPWLCCPLCTVLFWRAVFQKSIVAFN